MATLRHDLAADFAATAEDILTRVSSNPEVGRDLEAGGFSPVGWAAAADAGWLEALVVETAGGLGLSLRELGPIFTVAGRHLFVGPLAEHAVAGALAASAATRPARDRLGAVLGGDGLLAFADPAAAGALGGAVPQLRRGRLTGASDQVRFASQAGELLVAAESDAGPALVMVETGRGGVAVGARPSLDPVTRLADVFFDDVEVRDGDLVASGDGAVELLARTRAGMRIAIACELSGIADHVLALAVGYAKERQQFGRPIGSFQALQHILAEMAREAFGLRRLCREAAGAANDDLEQLEDISLVAKAHAAGVARSVTEGSLQVHGGIAFTIEHELHRYYNHVLFLEGFYGDRREQHEALGRRLLATSSDPWPAWR